MNRYQSKRKAILLLAFLGLSLAIITPLLVINLQKQQELRGRAQDTSASQSGVIPQGMIADWKFDEATGTTVSDSIGVSNGIFVGNPQWTPGKLGSALDFNGQNSRINVVSQGVVNNMNAMTVSAWVYARPGARRIITKGNTRPVRFYIASPTAQPIGQNIIEFGAGYNGGAGTWDTPAGSLSYNAWHQVTITYTHGNAANSPSIYIDGILQTSVPVNIPSGNPLPDDSSLYFGDRGDGVNFFDGKIDEVRIYNRILSSSEVSALYTADSPRAGNKPNIVVIMTDDQDDMGSMAVMPKTKNLIGSQGLTFTNSFVDFSLCCPSRASFLTGQASHNTGILANGGPDGGYQKFQPTEGNSLPVWLQKAGYVTAHMGKYLNGFGAGNVPSNSPDHIPPGWTLWNGIPDSLGGYSYYNYTINENGFMHQYGSTAADYKTDVQAQKAADFIASRQNSAQPFFLWLAPFAPHSTIAESNIEKPGLATPALRHLGLFNSTSLPQPPNFNEADVSDKPGFVQRFPLMDASSIANTTASFRRRRESLLAVDDMVEQVVTALQNAGKLDNTIIVFTSDNGFFEGQHRRPGGKQLVYEESIRVPLLMRGPGIAKGQSRNQLVNNLDLVATIEELAGTIPGRIPDGHSLTSLFQNAVASWRSSLLVQGMDTVFVDAHLYGRFQAVRTNNYIYAEHNGTDFGFEKEFYNLVTDPYELTSKPNDPAYASVINNLQSQLNTLRTCAGASCWMTAAEPSPYPTPTLTFTASPSPTQSSPCSHGSRCRK